MVPVLSILHRPSHLAPSLGFLFGRIVEIKVFIRVRATDLLPASSDSGIESRLAGDSSKEGVDLASVLYKAFTVSRL